MRRYSHSFLALTVTLALISGCGFTDEDYKSGQWWLESEGNWRMAVKAFQRSVDKSPRRWKSHVALLDALSHGDDAVAMENAVRAVLKFYPESSRSPAVAGPGTMVLGEQRYNNLVSALEQHSIGKLLASKGDKLELLARAIMAATRGRDTLAVRDYYLRLLTKLDSPDAPDTVVQEMNFFIGPARVQWLKYDWMVSHKPEDTAPRLAQLDVGVVLGDSSVVRTKLKELAQRIPDALKDSDIPLRYGQFIGADPFRARTLVEGWDGALSPDGRQIAYIRDRGTRGNPDQYIFSARADGSGEAPVMKAAQQFLSVLALPRWSPDGRWIYFYGSPDRNWSPGSVGRFSLFRVSPEYGARPKKLTDDDLILTVPHFAADGSVLLVRRDVGSTRSSVEVIRLNPDRARSESVSRIGEPVSSATFTPAGDSVLFTTDRGIFRRSVSGGNITVDLPWQGMSFLLLSPDGRQLLLNNVSGQALLIDRSSGKPMWLGTTASPLGAFGEQNSLLVTRFTQGRRQIIKLNLAGDEGVRDRFAQALKDN